MRARRRTVRLPCGNLPRTSLPLPVTPRERGRNLSSEASPAYPGDTLSVHARPGAPRGRGRGRPPARLRPEGQRLGEEVLDGHGAREDVEPRQLEADAGVERRLRPHDDDHGDARRDALEERRVLARAEPELGGGPDDGRGAP